jgi:hypothetical protein
MDRLEGTLMKNTDAWGSKAAAVIESVLEVVRGE